MTLQDFFSELDKVGPYADVRQIEPAIGLALLKGEVLAQSPANPIKVEAVQTFWSAPYERKFPVSDRSNNLGWPTRFSALCSWILSSGLLSRFATSTTLLTDKAGMTLALQLGLPYSEIKLGLEGIDNFIPANISWLANAVACSKLTKKTLLVDRSTFLFEPISHPDPDQSSTLVSAMLPLWQVKGSTALQKDYGRSLMDLHKRCPLKQSWTDAITEKVTTSITPGFYYGGTELAVACQELLSWSAENKTLLQGAMFNANPAMLICLSSALRGHSVRSLFTPISQLFAARHGYSSFQGSSFEHSESRQCMEYFTRRLFPLQYEAALKYV